jgi:hypothetical protein
LRTSQAALAHDRKMRIREEGIEALDAAVADTFLRIARIVR